MMLSEQEQIVHGAQFEAETLGVDDLPDQQINALLERIDEGLRAHHNANREKLRIALEYGPLLLRIKELSPHGTFLTTLKDRFPKTNYSICRRWLYLSRHEEAIKEALSVHPNKAWGPTTMIRYLKDKDRQNVVSVEEYWEDEEFVDDQELEPDLSSTPGVIRFDPHVEVEDIEEQRDESQVASDTRRTNRFKNKTNLDSKSIDETVSGLDSLRTENIKPQPINNVRLGDKVYIVRNYEFEDGNIYVEEKTVKKIVKSTVHFEGTMTADANAIFEKCEAEKQRILELDAWIERLEEEIQELRKQRQGTCK